MYSGPVFRLKVVRFYENLPLHYTGESARVYCASAATKDEPESEMQEAGWRTLGNTGAIGSTSAANVAATLRSRYRVVDDRTLVWIDNGVRITRDACGSFTEWYPHLVPDELVIHSPERPVDCATNRATPCRYWDLGGARQPTFDDVHVSEVRITFWATSPGLVNGRVRVSSDDNGRTWRYDQSEQ